MTNRELLNLLKNLETSNPELLDDEIVINFMESDFETDIVEAGFRTETLSDDFEFVKLDKPLFKITVNS